MRNHSDRFQLVNSVLPTKLYEIFTAGGRFCLAEIQADSAAEAMAEARLRYPGEARLALRKGAK